MTETNETPAEDQEAPEGRNVLGVVDETEGQVDGGPSPVVDEDQAVDEDQVDEAPGRHSSSAGYGVTAKFSTTAGKADEK